MLFYKVAGMLINNGAENEDSRRAQREAARRIYMKSEDYNHKCGRDAYCFVSESADGLLTAGMIVDQAEDAQHTAEVFLNYIGCPLKDMTLSEVTIGTVQQMLGRSDNYCFIEDADEILEKFGIDRAIGRRGRGIEFGENIIDDCTREGIAGKVDRYLLGETLLPELDRIYAGSTSKKAQGHPVH